MKSFTDKVAVVTGAGSGIGRAIALRLSNEGAIVHCVDLNKDNADAVARECRAGVAHRVDVTDVAGMKALAETVLTKNGRVDILINNAGIAHAGNIVDCEIEDWRRLFHVNVMGVVHGLHAFLPLMLKQKTHVISSIRPQERVCSPTQVWGPTACPSTPSSASARFWPPNFTTA